MAPDAAAASTAAAPAPVDTLCMGCASASCDFKPLRLQRRPLGEGDVLIDMKYCGICHSDGARVRLRKCAVRCGRSAATLWRHKDLLHARARARRRRRAQRQRDSRGPGAAPRGRACGTRRWPPAWRRVRRARRGAMHLAARARAGGGGNRYASVPLCNSPRPHVHPPPSITPRLLRAPARPPAAHIARGAIEAVGGKVAYPIVPGHELAGICSAVGPGVTKFKVGDAVGVGCMVDACLECAACKRGEEQKCSKGNIATYNGRNKHGRAATFPEGGATLGGYTTRMVVHERFGIRLPEGYPLEYAGPVMCAGVTLFDPLRRYGATKGTKVGVVGLGGLGQMGIRIAKAMGCTVTALSRLEAKRALATECGADAFVPSDDAAAMAAAAGSLDLVLNTIPSDHDYHAYSKLCARKGGKHVLLGLNNALGAAMMVDGLTFGASRVKMSGIGGIEATQAVVDLCAAHNIKPAVKIIGAHEINGVYEALENGNDSGLRHVLDIGTLNEGAFDACTAPPPDFSKAHAKGMSVGGMLGAAAEMFFCGKWL
jgi:D-arabinose 1-dehydrogenase-like Zn-dependent alcohol dehydrogenase